MKMRILMYKILFNCGILKKKSPEYFSSKTPKKEISENLFL